MEQVAFPQMRKGAGYNQLAATHRRDTWGPKTLMPSSPQLTAALREQCSVNTVLLISSSVPCEISWDLHIQSNYKWNCSGLCPVRPSLHGLPMLWSPAGVRLPGFCAQLLGQTARQAKCFLFCFCFKTFSLLCKWSPGQRKPKPLSRSNDPDFDKNDYFYFIMLWSKIRLQKLPRQRDHNQVKDNKKPS